MGPGETQFKGKVKGHALSILGPGGCERPDLKVSFKANGVAVCNVVHLQLGLNH